APPAGSGAGKPADSVPTASPTKPAGSPAGATTRQPVDSTTTASPTKPTAPRVAAAGDSSHPDPVSDDQPKHGSSRVLPLTFGAGALVLGGAALGFHLWGNSAYDDAKKEMQDQARRNSLYDSAN